MENFNIDEIKKQCKAKRKTVTVNIKDIKVIYFLYNDPDVAKNKLMTELRRSGETVQKINKFIKDYFKNNKIDEVNDDLFAKIAEDYNEK